MKTNPGGFYPELKSTIQRALDLPISEERAQVLLPLIRFIQQKLRKKESVNLNFICTHNSRRSQFSQIWAKLASEYFGVQIHSYSGGVEVTALNHRAVESLKRSGFQISFTENGSNPIYQVAFADSEPTITAFSKVFDDSANACSGFAAVMTCDHADENCPYIPGTEERIPVRYEDPKAFDDTELEAAKYDERSLQIASEMLYIFKNVAQNEKLL